MMARAYLWDAAERAHGAANIPTVRVRERTGSPRTCARQRFDVRVIDALQHDLRKVVSLIENQPVKNGLVGVEETCFF